MIDPTIEQSIETLKNKIRIAKDTSTDIPADNVDKILDALAIVEVFFRRADVENILEKSNSGAALQDKLKEAEENLDIEKMIEKNKNKREQEFRAILAIATASVGAGVAFGSIFGFF